MTWVDLVVLGIVAVSGMLALSRGLVREILGLGAWAGAAAFAYWGTPLARPQFERWIPSPEWVGPVTAAALFIGSLLILMLVCGWIGSLVRGSALGGLDRTLGLVFGLARGALLVVFAYILAGMVIPIDQWPGVVLRARLLPLTYQGAVWVADHLPPGIGLHRPNAPPVAKQTTAQDLLHAQPLGRAVGPSPRVQTRN
jgi:membrane protein required for colicin V production